MFEKFPKIVQEAYEYAAAAHDGQLRKYTGEDYIVHPIAVAKLVWKHTKDPDVTAAALMHDLIEDTDVTYRDIRLQFGEKIADLVLETTKPSKKDDGVRAVRKEIDRKFWARISKDGQTIKLADIICNTIDIVENDPKFAKVYVIEQCNLVNSLVKGNKYLFKTAKAVVAAELAELENMEKHDEA